eukprot:CAMPEP_0195097518 /NCGR_PEP_ID=MMETSP0448-20130528/53351_1 /TAXON_ID=66468 /ORGANISM="Heterocapsa triquestra, Strain CCMP 448" /LENGTH=50 /DNA_ID=CAMNT_0040132071 /DNA_START=47 /DNA_END=196 /DNA_ORIENTATION=+
MTQRLNILSARYPVHETHALGADGCDFAGASSSSSAESSSAESASESSSP